MESEPKLVKKEGILHGILFSFILALIPAMLLGVLIYEITPESFLVKLNPIQVLIISQIICMVIIFCLRSFIANIMKKADDKIKPIVSFTVVLPTIEQEGKYTKNAIRHNFVIQIVALLFFVLSILYQNLSLFWIWLSIVILLTWSACHYLYIRLMGNNLRFYLTGNDLNSTLIMLIFIFTWMGILQLESWGNVLTIIAFLSPVVVIAIIINIVAYKSESKYIIPKEYPSISVEKQKTPLMIYATVLLIWTIILFFAKNAIPLDVVDFNYLF